ncbi:MAG: phospho-N-acetylmuramoyl-pentapeptide-transferase [Chlamydiia bacterium]|nr:phospho-N-acetylmuramoyl-pentapeptide-transferase [Chlamydiia bacterium]
MAALTALILSIFLGPRFIRKLYSLKIGQPIRVEECPLLGELHHDKKDTPTMGGILVVFSLIVSTLLWGDLSSSYLKLLLVVTLLFSFLGGRDDYLKLKYKKNSKGLSGKKKLLTQGAIAALVALFMLIPGFTNFFGEMPVIKEGLYALNLQAFAGNIYVPFMKTPWLQLSGVGLIGIFFWILFIVVGTSNAVNLTDGLDGLASGLLVMAGLAFGIFAYLMSVESFADYLNLVYIDQASEVAVFLAAMIGALLGFLWFNGFPAQLFMGDIGSLTLGGILGTVAILLGRGLLLGIVGAVFVAEALSVILQVISYRYFNKKRIFLCAPLHHHFEYKGMKETKIVIRFWIVGLLCLLIGLISIKFQ